jgi:hypothetical protein
MSLIIYIEKVYSYEYEYDPIEYVEKEIHKEIECACKVTFKECEQLITLRPQKNEKKKDEKIERQQDPEETLRLIQSKRKNIVYNLGVELKDNDSLLIHCYKPEKSTKKYTIHTVYINNKIIFD